MSCVFVTGSGTDVGKTFVMCLLIAGLQAAGKRLRVLKPIATGFDAADPRASDTGELIRAQHLPLTAETVDATTPWRFAAPLSPDAAARCEGREISFAELVAFCRRPADPELTLIEGIGGLMVPIDPAHTVLDWIATLAPRVLLVTGSYLGTLSHTLTALEALDARGLRPVGLVVSESLEQPMPLEETIDTLHRFVPDVPIVKVPRGHATAGSSAQLAALLRH